MFEISFVVHESNTKVTGCFCPIICNSNKLLKTK